MKGRWSNQRTQVGNWARIFFPMRLNKWTNKYSAHLNFTHCIGIIQGNTVLGFQKILENFQLNLWALSEMIFRKIAIEIETNNWLKINSPKKFLGKKQDTDYSSKHWIRTGNCIFFLIDKISHHINIKIIPCIICVNICIT